MMMMMMMMMMIIILIVIIIIIIICIIIMMIIIKCMHAYAFKCMCVLCFNHNYEIMAINQTNSVTSWSI